MAVASNSRLRFSPAVPALLALGVLVLPLKWLLAAALAAAVHELFHVGAICLCGGRLLAGEMTPGRIQIHTCRLTDAQELLCAAAGPLGSALLMLTARWLPRTAVVAAIHCAFNLLPIYPMDGGRVLCSGLSLLLGRERAERICLRLAWVLKAVLACVGAFLAAFRGFGVAVLIALLAIWSRRGREMSNFS